MSDEGSSLFTNLHDSLDGCIENASIYKVYLIAIILALGNAADAIEIMSVGYIMSERDDLSSLDKGMFEITCFKCPSID